MNDLTLFIYLASVIPSMVTFITIVLVLLILLSGLLLGIRSANANDAKESAYNKVYAKDKVAAAEAYFTEAKWKIHIKHIVWSLVVILLLMLVPDRQTMILMAGSEASEAAVTSDTGQEILNEIKNTITFQLKQLQGVK